MLSVCVLGKHLLFHLHWQDREELQFFVNTVEQETVESSDGEV